jgi:hypothetical protein
VLQQVDRHPVTQQTLQPNSDHDRQPSHQGSWRTHAYTNRWRKPPFSFRRNMRTKPVRGGHKAFFEAESITSEAFTGFQLNQADFPIGSQSDDGAEDNPEIQESAILLQPHLTWVPL